MSTEDSTHDLLQFIGTLRDQHIMHSGLSTVEAARQFDEGMRPLVEARIKELHEVEHQNVPSQAEMLMELVLEVEQVVALVPPRLRAYREKLAAEGLDKTVVVSVPAGQAGSDGESSGGREGMPGINLADQAALEFHSQLLQLSFAIAQDEVQQRMARRSEQPAEQP